MRIRIKMIEPSYAKPDAFAEFHLTPTLTASIGERSLSTSVVYKGGCLALEWGCWGVGLFFSYKTIKAVKPFPRKP